MFIGSDTMCARESYVYVIMYTHRMAVCTTETQRQSSGRAHSSRMARNHWLDSQNVISAFVSCAFRGSGAILNSDGRSRLLPNSTRLNWLNVTLQTVPAKSHSLILSIDSTTHPFDEPISRGLCVENGKSIEKWEFYFIDAGLKLRFPGCWMDLLSTVHR